MTIGRWRIVAGALVVVAALGVWLLKTQPHEPAATTTANEPPIAPFTTAPALPPVVSKNDAAATNPQVDFERWLREHSSLRGAGLDGDWGVLDDQDRLKPSRALRRRFDQLLTLQGEVSIAQIGAFIEQSARQAHGPAGTTQLIDLWLRYKALLGQNYATGLDLADRRSWPVALAERHAARIAALGPEWAAAFFAQEEGELRALIQAAAADPQSGLASAPLIDPATLSPDARQRLEAEQQAWQDWEARLAQARIEWARLQAHAAGGDDERRAAIEAWISAHFDVAEQRRVRALLRIPPRTP